MRATIGRRTSQRPNATFSPLAALTYFELAAQSHNVGTCWAGFLQIAMGMAPAVQEALQLPDGHQGVAAMMVGHPQFEYHRIPVRKPANVVWR